MRGAEYADRAEAVVAELAERVGAPVMAWDYENVPLRVLCCEECGCIFVPDHDGELVYPDRYVRPSDPDHHCICHDLPTFVEDPDMLRDVFLPWHALATAAAYRPRRRRHFPQTIPQTTRSEETE